MKRYKRGRNPSFKVPLSRTYTKRKRRLLEGKESIARFLIWAYGPKCKEFVGGCPCCDVWRIYDEYIKCGKYEESGRYDL